MKVTFIGAGSTIFMKNIIGDVLLFPALSSATIALMDIDAKRLEESRLVAEKMVASVGVAAKIETYASQREALVNADFVIVAFQIGGYKPCTVTDFEVPKKFGLRQTIGDTLGVGGIMRGLRTVPHLWSVCEDMLAVCAKATLLQYVNPIAINTRAIAERYPDIKQIGLCHSVQGTIKELAYDMNLRFEDIRYTSAGINHVAFFLNLEHRQPDGSYQDLYPALVESYRNGAVPKPNRFQPRCLNKVRYEVMTKLGYFVTESSEHFSEYVPWFIKRDRPDLIEKFSIPLDEYPNRCEEQIENRQAQAEILSNSKIIEVERSHEYAATIMNAIATGEPAVVYGNVSNNGYIPQLPKGATVEVPCLVDGNGIHPTVIEDIPPQLIALMMTNLNVHSLTVHALLKEDVSHLYHAAMMDPHTAGELDLDQIWQLVDELREAHGDWLPMWARYSIRCPSSEFLGPIAV